MRAQNVQKNICTIIRATKALRELFKLEVASLQRMGLLGNCTEATYGKHDPDQLLDSLCETLLMEPDIIQSSVLTV